MSLLRRYIRALLSENKESFMKDFEPLQWQYDGDDESVEMEQLGSIETQIKNPQKKVAPREMKKLFHKHADHAFFDSLVKVHFAVSTNLENIFTMSNKNELSARAFPDEASVTKPARSYVGGGVGIELQGRVTFAAKNEDDISTGTKWEFETDGKQKSYADQLDQYKKTSGLPRRPTRMYFKGKGSDFPYILDAETYKGVDPTKSEVVIDNWTPVAIWVPKEKPQSRVDSFGKEKRNESGIKDWQLATELSKKYNVPLKEY